MREARHGDDHLAPLIARIRRLYYVEAGQPSYSVLAKVADNILSECESKEDKEWLRPLPRATASDLISGRHTKCPDWWVIRTLVLACHRIATKSDLDIAPLEDLTKEFSRLFKAAKAADGGATPIASGGELQSDAETTNSPAVGDGDILAPLPGEASPPRSVPATLICPEGWSRSSRRRLEEAEAGDARAAYEVAVLLACTALGEGSRGDEKAEAERWRELAAYWRGRALGKVAEAAELRLDGVPLAKAAYAIAAEYRKLGKRIFMDFIAAATEAEASIQGSRIAPATTETTAELITEGHSG
ncbi:hypothetical protein [Microbispora rosea]|uniref:hypothetical protein n=1 Tax=Microbispora rosea TaxID=58117 RepID=UPI0034126FEF